MAREVLELLELKRPDLVPYLSNVAFGGEEHHGEIYRTTQGNELKIIGNRPERESFVFPDKSVAIEYSTPNSALENISYFCEKGISFVSGTTGYDMDEGKRLVENSKINAVIAPNMAVPIVLIQKALEDLAKEFPESLEGFNLTVSESHQATKKDQSGTARAFLPHFENLGCGMDSAPISSIRSPEKQRELGVPEAHLSGHGWHWYRLVSEDESTVLELSHQVNGRRIYAEGTLKALDYLMSKVEQKRHGTVWSMRDVLSGK